MTDLTPREIVSELDRFIIGQAEAKRAVAVALRSRWRRQHLPAALQDEVYPKNILMIGPTGVGKTEISRRLAKLARAPFIKVEATKFTEVGYVGRDVEQIIRDLMDAAIVTVREYMREDVKSRAIQAAEERVLAAIAGEDARESTKEMFRKKLRAGELDDAGLWLEERVESRDEHPLSHITCEVPVHSLEGSLDVSSAGRELGAQIGARCRTDKRAGDPLTAHAADQEPDLSL